MKTRVLSLTLAAGLAVFSLTSARPAAGQETPKSTVETYSAIADGILALNKAETDVVRVILESHHDAGAALAAHGEWEKAAAEVALFANEGDNAVGGVRKRLLEGNHHHNAEGEAAGTYEPGYVIVTRAAKTKGLAIAAALRQAKTDGDRKKAWNDFEALAKEVLGKH